MWSDRYTYYNILYDRHFSQKLHKSVVVECLLETKLFRQVTHQQFTNSDQFLWVDMLLVETYTGNFASSDEDNPFVTLIAIVCSKGPQINQQVYINAFLQVARKLNWKLYLEQDDDGNEGIEIEIDTGV